MPIIYVNDENTGRIVAVDTETPSGYLYARDSESGDFMYLNLSNPSGTLNVVDSNSGDILPINLSTPSGILSVVDANTGDIVSIDLGSPSGILNVLDANSGDTVQLNLSTDRFINTGGIPLVLGAETPWYLKGGIPLANCIAAYQPEGALSLLQSYTNLAHPGVNDAAPGTAPTWSSANGWMFSSAGSQYLNTGITPSSGMSAIIKFSNISNKDSYLFGSATSGTTGFQIIPWLSAPEHVRYANGGSITKSPYLSEGVLAFAGTKGYRNGVDDGVTIGAWSGTSTHPIHIGRLNRASPTGYISGYIKAIAFYNIVLTQAQVSAIYEAIATPFRPTPTGTGEFMFVFVPDTHYQDAATAVIHEQMMEYVANNSSDLGIRAVIHVGDLVYPPLELLDNYQWNAADAMIANLDGAEIPYLVTIGNHDYDGDNATDVIGRNSTRFNSTFPQSRYTNHGWWNGGFFEVGRTENAYMLLTIDSIDWIFITMEFGPRDAVLTWVDSLLTTYSTRHAIIVTHSYIHRDGTTVGATDQYAATSYTLDGDRNNGDDIWNVLKSHDNIRLILSGHDKGTIGWASATLQTNSDPGGIPINQSVANWQSYQTYGAGMMQFFRINPTLKTIKCESFSPRMNMFFHDPANEYTVDWS